MTTRTLIDTPAYNQLNDGNDPYQTTDCGLECVAMVANIVKKSQPNIMEGTYREILGQLQHVGVGRPGLTTSWDLHQLCDFLDIPSQVRSDNIHDCMVNWNTYLHAGQACVVLGTWDSAELHWLLFLASPPGPYWTVNDPWGGVRRSITDQLCMSDYAGSYLHIQTGPDSQP